MSNAAQSKAAARIESLLDANSFVEIGQAVTARSTDFNMAENKAPSDGVITGYGLIDGNPVYVYSQDASVLGGTVGEMHARKIIRLYDLARKTGAPVVGLLDCAGIRLQESTDALDAFGRIFFESTLCSGIIPQVTGVFGPCGGGMALLAAMSDFTFMDEKNGKLFVNSPNALEGNHVSKRDTSTAEFQSAETGVVDGCGSEEEVIAKIRGLISLLPSNCEDESLAECTDDLNRVCEDLENCVADGALALARIADNEDFFETTPAYGRDMVTGFMRLNGAVIGAVANRSVIYDEEGKEAETFDGTISANGAKKAAAFVKFCDAFEIPVLTLTDACGFKATLCSERHIAAAAAQMIQAFANATVPKVNVVTGKAYGSAYTVMNSRALGADAVFAWESAEIGMMDAAMAAKIMYADADSSVQREKAAEYRSLQSGVDAAAKRGYVDTIIAPADTRKYVINAFEMLYTKSEDRPAKKHCSV